MELQGLFFASFQTALGASVAGHFCGVGEGVGFFFGLVSYPIADVSSILLRPASRVYTLTPNGGVHESTLDSIRSIALPVFLGSLAAWGTLAMAGFPLSFTSILILTAGGLIWDIFMNECKDKVKTAYA
jgi:hypothetical protein